MSNQMVFDFVIDVDKAIDLAKQGLYCDGAWHKQYILEQILVALGVDVEDLYKRALEDPVYGEWERGIP